MENTTKTAFTELVMTYDPKNYKSRDFALGFASKLQRAEISHLINRDSNTSHRIMVSTWDLEKAKQVRTEYTNKKEADRQAFIKGIKLETSRKFQFNVNSLYNRLKPNFPGQIYLPESWKGGKSIQNYSQNDFYSFELVYVRGSKELDGPKVIMTMLSKRMVLILPTNFQSQINGLIEDLKMEGTLFQTNFEQFISKLAIKQFNGQEWESFFTEKKIFWTSKN